MFTGQPTCLDPYKNNPFQPKLNFLDTQPTQPIHFSTFSFLLFYYVYNLFLQNQTNEIVIILLQQTNWNNSSDYPSGIHKKPNDGANKPCSHHERLEKKNQNENTRKNRGSFSLIASMYRLFLCWRETVVFPPGYSHFLTHYIIWRLVFKMLHFIYICILFFYTNIYLMYVNWTHKSISIYMFSHS